MTITKESIVLIAICTLDLVLTLLFIGHNMASEGNPLMDYYLRYGIRTFIMIKLAMIILPIFVAEYSRRYKPKFVRFMLRATIAAYVGTYLILFLTVNIIPAMNMHNTDKPSMQVQIVQK